MAPQRDPLAYTALSTRTRLLRATSAALAAAGTVAVSSITGCASNDPAEPPARTSPPAPVTEAPGHASTSTTGRSRPTVTPGQVVWFGDSLTDSSVVELHAAFHTTFARPWRLKVSSFGGTALCDWLPAISNALRSDANPSLLVLAFYGNNFTRCMGAGPDGVTIAQGSADFFARYRSAMDQVTAMSVETGVPVVWVQSPPRSASVAGGPVGVRDGLDALALEQGWPVLEAGQAVADRNGTFAIWLPCDEFDGPACVDGQVKVRSDDRVHFEPGPDRTGMSPGSRRWATKAVTLLADTITP